MKSSKLPNIDRAATRIVQILTMQNKVTKFQLQESKQAPILTSLNREIL